MKHLFNKSFVLISFISTVTIVLILGVSLILGQNADANDSSGIWGLTVLIVIILLLNITDIIAYWINGKSQEIKTKYIVGIQEKKIYSRIILNMNFLNLVSFIIGSALSVVIAYIISSFSTYLIVNISLSSVFFAFAFNTVLMNGVGILFLNYKLKNGYPGLR